MIPQHGRTAQRNSLPRRRVWRNRLLRGLVVPLCWPLGAALADGQATTSAPTALTAPAAGSGLTLVECLRIAGDQQPALAAQRATLASANTQSSGLQKLHVPPFIARDLPIRKEQACLGVSIAEAGLSQAQAETAYAVIRTYYGVVYAREQQKVAENLVTSLRFYQERVKELVTKGDSREYTTSTVDKITLYLRLAETRQAEAARGIERATAALREAMGVSPETPVEVAKEKLPSPTVKVDRKEIMAMALARRGELAQATTVAEVVELEIKAQGKSFRPTARTFAAVADVHAVPVPQGISNGEYRPGATGLDMPTLFAGSRSTRVERARDLSQRAAAVVDKTRNLVALDADDAYLKWEEAERKLTSTRDAAKAGERLSKNTREYFSAGQKISIQDILTDEVLSAQAQATHNETLYTLVISLAGLQRVTAGGFDAGLTSAASN